MSVAKRIIDLAKANLNTLLERAAETVDPRRRLASIPDAELEAELQRRRSARVAEEKVAQAKAHIDGPGGERMAQDRADRERQAREREARVKAAREGRERAEKERAARAAQEARAAYERVRSGGSSGSQQQPPPRKPGATRGKNNDLARYYERLEIPYGSDFEAVKGAYRRLMRKYHPDLHVNKSAEKQRAAHEVSQALTQAYNELEKHLQGGPNRRG